MTSRQFSTTGVFAILLAVLPTSAMPKDAQPTREPSEQQEHGETPGLSTQSPSALPVPSEGKIPVAFVLGKNAEVLDFCGPLEVFAGAYTSDGRRLFAPYTVAATPEPVTVGGGMRVVPDHTFKTAPAPKIIVIPAMADAAVTPEMIDWIRQASKSTDVTLSVCNGVFVLARTGLLAGKRATAHHMGYFRFAGMFPDVELKRGWRYVEVGNIASAGGVSSGIDLALRVVERYVGRTAATQLADGIEYHGKGWLDPESNQAFAAMPALDGQRPLCPLCLMDGDPAVKSVHRGKTYYFCAEGEKEFFEKHLDVFDRFLAEDAARRGAVKK